MSESGSKASCLPENTYRVLGMTNRLQWVILSRGEREGASSPVSASPCSLFIHIDSVVQVWGTTHEKSYRLARSRFDRAGFCSSFRTSVGRSTGCCSKRAEEASHQEAEDARQARSGFGSRFGSWHERQGHAKLSCRPILRASFTVDCTAPLVGECSTNRMKTLQAKRPEHELWPFCIRDSFVAVISRQGRV
jgi:hypothetical protein